MKHYKIYDMAEDEEHYDVCLEHPTNNEFSLCGSKISDTPDGQPIETDEPVTCKFCLSIIKEIAKLESKIIDILTEFLDKEFPLCPEYDHSGEQCNKSKCKECWYKWAYKKAKEELNA